MRDVGFITRCRGLAYGVDVHACDRWKKERCFQFYKGHNCGICSAVCPYGLNVLKKRVDKSFL